MIRNAPTFMAQEIAEIPAAVGRLLAEGATDFRNAGQQLRQLDPVMIATVARGSSDHAASFLKYAIELVAGVPVASIGPSVSSVYGRELRMHRCAALAISQSGKSPDIVTMAKSARDGGALTIALTNTAGSPLGEACELGIDLRAGPERSVAATKTFVSSVVAGLALLAEWQDDDRLRQALAELPATLQQAVAVDWSSLVRGLEGRQSLFVLGRGPALAIASEAALKFKETCGIQAEAYSAAEVMHGPVRIVENNYPVLALVARDAAEESVRAIFPRLSEQGAQVFATTQGGEGATSLPFASGAHPLTDALALVGSFYAFIEGLARWRGFDPDRPPNLKKVTETI